MQTDGGSLEPCQITEGDMAGVGGEEDASLWKTEEEYTSISGGGGDGDRLDAMCLLSPVTPTLEGLPVADVGADEETTEDRSTTATAGGSIGTPTAKTVSREEPGTSAKKNTSRHETSPRAKGKSAATSNEDSHVSDTAAVHGEHIYAYRSPHH